MVIKCVITQNFHLLAVGDLRLKCYKSIKKTKVEKEQEESVLT